jgi:hypothetical protein
VKKPVSRKTILVKYVMGTWEGEILKNSFSEKSNMWE